MPPAVIDRTRSRAAFDEIARHVAGGESSYARHGGTYTGSPFGLAASAAVLRRVAAEPWPDDELEAQSAVLADGIEELGRWFGFVAHGPDEIDATLHAVRGAAEDLSR